MRDKEAGGVQDLEGQSEWLRVDLVSNGEPWTVFERGRSPLLVGLFFGLTVQLVGY